MTLTGSNLRRPSRSLGPGRRQGLFQRRSLTIALGIFCCTFVFYLSSITQFPNRNFQQESDLNWDGDPVMRIEINENRPALSLVAKEKPVVIAYAVSLIKCSKQGSTVGFLDAAAVLRHSVHKQSIHNGPDPVGRYSYKMYGIVHEDCKHYAPVFERLGYTVMIVNDPVKAEDIKEGWYKDHVKNENCCGSTEFIKLYAYLLLDHPISVHLDMDYALLQPMDDLFDSMLYDKDSPQGKIARGRLELEFPYVPLPDTIDAFVTRDVTSSQPLEKRMVVQGGFLVARTSQEAFDKYLEIIKEADYVPKYWRGEGTGWKGMGYGGLQGAMAYQGILAFFYDYWRPGTAVDLDVCRWNNVIADVIWRGPEKMDYNGTCRKYPHADYPTPDLKDCEDCRSIPISKMKSIHYTACKKPWACTVPNPRIPRDKRQVYRLSHLTNVTTCGLAHREWFQLRREFEDSLLAASKGEVAFSKRNGVYEPNAFLGYCQGSGRYIPMTPPPENFDVSQIYGL